MNYDNGRAYFDTAIGLIYNCSIFTSIFFTNLHEIAIDSIFYDFLLENDDARHVKDIHNDSNSPITRCETREWLSRIKYLINEHPDIPMYNKYQSITELLLVHCQNRTIIQRLNKLGFDFRRETSIPHNPRLYHIFSNIEYFLNNLPLSDFQKLQYSIPSWFNQPLIRRLELLSILHE